MARVYHLLESGPVGHGPRADGRPSVLRIRIANDDRVLWCDIARYKQLGTVGSSLPRHQGSPGSVRHRNKPQEQNFPAQTSQSLPASFATAQLQQCRYITCGKGCGYRGKPGEDCLLVVGCRRGF